MVGALNVFEEDQIDFLSKLIQAYLECRSLRISSLANTLPGNYKSRYKEIQRFLESMPEESLSRGLLSFTGDYSDAVVLDYVEIPREWACKTDYVGYLKDGKTRGVGFLGISIPYKGRALPIGASPYSSAIIENDPSSKTIICHHALEEIRPALNGKVILADREFCSEENFKYFKACDHQFAIRLKVGKSNNPVRITRKSKKEINYSIKKGQTKIWRNVYYKGTIKVHLIGFWDGKYKQPMYIISNISPKKALKMYKLRMKIEESFKDEKSKLGITKIMSRKQENFTKLISFSLLAYGIALLVGEDLRKVVLPKKSRKKFSGLHVLFYMIHSYTPKQLLSAANRALKFIKSINLITEGIASPYRWGYA